MNSEDKIYNKIKSASHKGEKDFPGMDKVWNRVEEKLDNTIVLQKKNTWQKLAIAATVALMVSVIYQFYSKNEVFKTEKTIMVSQDSVKKILEKAKEVVVDNNTPTKIITNKKANYNAEKTSAESSFFPEEITSSDIVIDDSAIKIDLKKDNLITNEKSELNKNISTNNEISLRNSAFNSSGSNNGYLVPTKKYETTKPVQSKYKVANSKVAEAPVQQNKNLVIIDGVAMDKNYNADKELNKISAEEMDDVTYLPNPLYLINGIEYTEESLFGKNPTSPYAPLNKQKITSTNILKSVEATKIYGKKGNNGIVIITTKDGKPSGK